MFYQFNVVFKSPTRSPDFTFSDIISDDDWTSKNYWDDFSDFMSNLIFYGEDVIKDIYPNGHDYNLSTVNITYLGDDEE